MKVKVYHNGKFINRQMHEDFKGNYILYNNHKMYIIPDKYDKDIYLIEGYKVPYK